MSRSQQLLAEFKGLAAGTEELIAQVADRTELGIVAARENARETLSRIRHEVLDRAHQSAARVRAVGDATNGYVHENPWPVVAGVAVAALVIGALLSRR